MNNEELKTCPFCGGEAEIVISGGDRRVDCKKCGARSDWYDTEAEAIAAWNRRNYPEKQDSSKLTYADVEKMVKPLKWKYISGIKAHYAFINKGMFFKICKENGDYVLSINANNPVAFSEKLSKIKQVAQKWLVDLVADALGVERSGE